MEEKVKAEIAEQTVQTETNPKTMKKYTWIKVVSSVIIALIVAWLMYGFFGIVLNSSSEEDRAIGVILFVILFIFEFGGIASLVSMAFSVSGLVLTLIKCPKTERKGQVIFFSALIAAPIIIEAVFYILCYIVA